MILTAHLDNLPQKLQSMADDGGGGDLPGHVPWSFVAQKKQEMMARLEKRARTSGGASSPPPALSLNTASPSLAAASSSRFHPSALPFTAPRLLHPPHLPPVPPPPTVDQGTQTGDGPERRIDSISRLVRWVLQNILPVMCI